jgi:hypothetical protein
LHGDDFKIAAKDRLLFSDSYYSSSAVVVVVYVYVTRERTHQKIMSTENRGGEAHTHNINNNNAFGGGGGGGQGGNFPRAIVPIQDVSEILSKYDFKEKIGTGGTTSRE